jgi:hypothetical protein
VPRPGVIASPCLTTKNRAHATRTLAVRLDHGQAALDEPRVARQIAAIQRRLCLAVERGDAHSADVFLEQYVAVRPSSDTRHPVCEPRCLAQVVVPHVPTTCDDVVSAVCDLAATLRAAVSVIALETSVRMARAFARGGPQPMARVGLNEHRLRERMFRHRYDARLDTKLAGVEWGTFLGPGHLAKIDIDDVRRSDAFARVVRLSADLVYLQVTDDPADDLTKGFERKLASARQALAPLLIHE